MIINVEKGTVSTAKTELMVLPVFGGKDFDAKKVKGIPDGLKLKFEKTAASQGFFGRTAQHVITQFPMNSPADELLVVGLGDKKGDVLGAIREVCGGAFITARRLGMKHITFFLPKEIANEKSAEALVMAALLSNYAFDTFKKENSDKRVEHFTVLVEDAKVIARLKKVVEWTDIVADGVTVARDLVNTPAQEITPSRLAMAAEEIVKASGKSVTLKVLGKKECKALGMGAFLAVSQGSDEEPKFIHLTYTSPRPSKKSLAVIGKGVTFDSGGLSLKPADAMMTMKCDMAGAAAVLGFFATLARLKPRINIHGIIAATENMPSGKAIRPGDVVRSMNGKTIEVLNTDAEGRMTLADAMTYIQREVKPDTMIELSTLTGAVLAALGEEIAGLMTNDRKLGKEILTSAKNAGEKMWELPLEDRYRQLIHSDIADLRNIPTNRYGGALTAGLFLEEFVEDGRAWAHLDIAGPAFAERPLSSYLGKGGSGFGVRTLVEFVREMK